MTLKEEIEDLISEAERPQKVYELAFEISADYNDEKVKLKFPPDSVGPYFISVHEDCETGVIYEFHKEIEESKDRAEKRKDRLYLEFVKGQIQILLRAEEIKNEAKVLKRFVEDNHIRIEGHYKEAFDSIFTPEKEKEKKAYQAGLNEGRKELEEYKRKIKELTK